MHDMIERQPDFADLYQVAVGQMGYFTTAQAEEHAISRKLLHHHVQTGKLERVYRGVYRFRDYPSAPREEVAAAWLAVGKDFAVVSHESALDLHQLSDVTPNAIDITIPREKRYLRPPRGITVHTSKRPIEPRDVRRIEGVPVTSPARTIVDVAEAGTSEEHVHSAAMEAIDRGIMSIHTLRKAAQSRSTRVREAIERAIDAAAS